MSELKTISKETPEQLSLQFDKLRELGLARVQDLSKEVWTDYNLHDPGVTTLEALCYAITDLGYRLTFDIQDLLANNPNDADEKDVDFKNFYTPREILHNAPVTLKDFRKLLMDIAVETDDTHELLGIKNAWLLLAADAEKKLFADYLADKLSYTPTITDPNGFFVRGLHNFLLEFDSSVVHGDLNSNALDGLYLINNFSDSHLDGVEIRINIHFPRWDDPAVNFEDDSSIIAHIEELEVEFDELPAGYTLEDTNTGDNKIILTGIKKIGGVPVAIPDLNLIDAKINAFLFTTADSLLAQYKRKMTIVKAIIRKAEERLHNNRPLCEDYLNIRALRVEEIAICGDIEIDPFADPATVAAHIYYTVSKFLSPDVYFYSLPEMKEKGKTTEEIFDGPALEHGFIDDDELEASAQKCNIRTSDLIRLIMDVEIDGQKPVKSVSGLQIANFPEDNDGSITQKSVKWCMSLAIDQLYVPRLSTKLSNLSFYKSDLPFSFDEEDMNLIFNTLSISAQKRYPLNPVLDQPVPKGQWRETTDYTSVQEDFPLVYGVGSQGIPNLPVTAPERSERITNAKQFKGFLSFFDQLLYNYLQQVNGLKSLFSLNQELDIYGQPLLNKTYFSESLLGDATAAEIVPNAADLALFDSDYGVSLQGITESKSDFEKRKNRFLDHLLARFCEQFSDYAIIAYTIDGQKAGAELIKDKLSFLNAYPEISSNRGKAFNYRHALNWYYQNVSGFEKRTAMLLGIDPKKANELLFSKEFIISETAGKWGFETKIITKLYFKNPVPFQTKTEAKSGVEQLVSAGALLKNYKLIPGTSANKFQIAIYGDGLQQNLVALSKSTNLTAVAAATMISEHQGFCLNELQTQILASRKNLAPPIENYFTVSSHTVDNTTTPHLHKISYKLFDKPAQDSTRKVILTGDLEGPEQKGANAAEIKKNTRLSLIWSLIRFASDEDYYRFNPGNVVISDPDYHFEIFDIYGNTIGKHLGKNYNKPLADRIENAVPANIMITGSISNNGVYTVNNTVAVGPNIKIGVNETLPSNYPDGKVVFDETFACSVAANRREITINGTDLTDRLRAGDELSLKRLSGDFQYFSILSINFSGGKTLIISSVLLDKPFAPEQISYAKTFGIKSSSAKTIIIRAGAEKLAVLDMVAFFNKIFIEREGMHLIEHLLLRPKTVFDKLLDIHTDVDCEQCKITDTYSFVMTAILPYWPDRFRDRNFRNFIEKTLREETPAHVALNVCWVSPLHMDLFEKAYKYWLIQSNTLAFDDPERIKALKDFIEVTQSLRSVYPSGKLHSCDEDNVQKNTLILNQTNIGIF
jgi:hypothetical protein